MADSDICWPCIEYRRHELAAALARSQLAVERAQTTVQCALTQRAVAQAQHAALQAIAAQLYPDSCPPGVNDSGPGKQPA
jgi:hypothetical protein